MPQDAPRQESAMNQRQKSAFYIDAFNLYYAIVNLEKPYLKWVNLWDLCLGLIPKQQEELVKVVFCSAFNRQNEGKVKRHQTYVRTLTHFGVICEMGHFVNEPRVCKECEHSWLEASEKQTDVNLALHLFHDASRNVYDHAYLVTADSDQAATAKMLKAFYPAKRLTTVVPPTKAVSHNILTYADGQINLTEDHLEKVVMPATVMGSDSKGPFVVAKRPENYAPPDGWVHPKDRPGKK
jgi:uncharacterized LabA/DUF88 family protein